MWFRVLLAGLFCSLGLAGGMARADDAADEKRYPTVKLIDAGMPPAERQATFEYFDRKALQGNTFAQYLIGSLYRIGNGLPGSIVPQDLAKANKYLSTAAAHGHVRAMAKMAELELSQKRYLEAMIWAQLFGYYSGLNGADAKTIRDNPESDYLADLIGRISARLDPGQMPTVQEDMNAVIAAHDADIRKGMASPPAWGASRGKMQPRSSSRRHAVAPPHPGGSEFRDVLADYLIAFDAKGDATDAWLIDAVPDIALGKALKSVALSTAVNPAEDGSAEPRYALQPINFSWGRYRLQPKK